MHCNIIENIIYINFRLFFSGFFKFKKMHTFMLIPMLLGGLIKFLSLIPVILIVALFIGLVSLLGSKLSLIISGILGIKTLLSMLPSLLPMPEMKMPKPSPPEGDWKDIQMLAMKQAHLMYPKKYMFDYTKYNYPQSDFTGKYGQFPLESVIYADNYVLPASIQNHFNADTTGKMLQDPRNVNGGHFTLEGNADDDRLKLLAAAEMAAKANSLLEKQSVETPNRRVGVKITKTIVKQSG